MRVGGTVGSSNFAAAYLSISLASAASLLFTNLRRAHKWLAVAVLGLGGVAPDFHIFAGGLDGLGAGSHGDLFARLEPPRILSEDADRRPLDTGECSICRFKALFLLGC